MAAKKTPTTLLTPDLEREARNLWVVGNDPDALRIAAILSERHGVKVHEASVRAAAKRGRWEVERVLLCEDPDVLASDAAHRQHMVDARAKVEALTADLAVVRLTGQLDVSRKLAAQAASSTAAKEVREVARALGPASQDVTSGRLAVGLSTEKSESENAQTALVAALLAAGGGAEVEAEWLTSLPTSPMLPKESDGSDGSSLVAPSGT